MLSPHSSLLVFGYKWTLRSSNAIPLAFVLPMPIVIKVTLTIRMTNKLYVQKRRETLIFQRLQEFLQLFDVLRQPIGAARVVSFVAGNSRVSGAVWRRRFPIIFTQPLVQLSTNRIGLQPEVRLNNVGEWLRGILQISKHLQNQCVWVLLSTDTIMATHRSPYDHPSHIGRIYKCVGWDGDTKNTRQLKSTYMLVMLGSLNLSPNLAHSNMAHRIKS